MKWSIVHTAVLCLAWASTAVAQSDLERFNRQLEQIHRQTRLQVDTEVPAGQRALVDYGALFSTSLWVIDDENQKTHVARQQDLEGYMQISIDGVHELFLRARSIYVDFNPGDSFDQHGDDWVEPTLERAYYSFDLKRYLSAYEGKSSENDLFIRAGRQLAHWANGLVLSRNIDGGTAKVTLDKLELDLVAGVTVPGNTDIDSSRPGFDGDTHRGFYGGMLTYETGTHRPYVYYLSQRDYNPDETLTVAAVNTRFDYDSWYLGCGSAGSFGDQWLYRLEVAYEGGSGLSNSFDMASGLQVPQTDDDISAFGADLQVDYLLQDSNNTKLTGQVLVATGDTDRLVSTDAFGGNQPGTTDHAFNAFGLIDTGLAFAPDVSNLIMLRAGASTFPLPNNRRFRRLQVGTNLFLFGKTQSDAPIDEQTNDDSYLGAEVDVFLNWQITSDLSLPVRYGVFFPGSAIAADKDERHFFYAALVLAF